MIDHPFKAWSVDIGEGPAVDGPDECERCGRPEREHLSTDEVAA